MNHDTQLSAAGYDFRIRVYRAEASNGSIMVWSHGGAFMFGTLEMPEADAVARALADRGSTVVSVDYTLAPLDAFDTLVGDEDVEEVQGREGVPAREQMLAEIAAAGPRARFPVASLQVAAAYEWAVDHAAELDGDPRRVSLGGASAGGNLAAGAALRLRDNGSHPAALALVYPVLHAELPAADAELERALEGLPRALTFPPESTTAISANYLGEASGDDPYAFAANGRKQGLPPTLIVTAERDRLRASAEAFNSDLARAGVATTIVREAGELHGFLNEPARASFSRTVAGIADFLVKRRPFDRPLL